MGLDIFNQTSVASVLDPVAADDTVSTAAVDRQGVGSPIVFDFNVGIEGVTLTGTDKITLTLEHSDASGSGFAAVTDPIHQLGTFETAASGIIKVLDAVADAPALYRVGYRGPKRYCRVTATFAGTHGAGTPMGCTAMKGYLRDQGLSL